MAGDITNRIISMLSQQGKKEIELCRAIGIGQSTFTNWKTRQTNPKSEYLPLIANFLGTSVEYLTTGIQPDGYYLNDEVAEIAQEIYEKPGLKMLFDASRKLSVDDITAVQSIVEQLWKKEHPEE